MTSTSLGNPQKILVFEEASVAPALHRFRNGSNDASQTIIDVVEFRGFVMNTHHTNPHWPVFPSPDGDREEAFFSRDDQASSQGPRVSLYARISDNPKAPRFDGVIGDVPVALFLRQPAGRSPFLSIVGALGTPRAKENLGTARVVTSPSGAPRLLVYLSAPIGGASPAAPSSPDGAPFEQRLFVSISKSLDQRVLLELGLDEHRQKAKRAAWEASRVKVVRPQDLEPDSPPKE